MFAGGRQHIALQYTTFQRLRLWDNVPSLPSGRPILLPESPGYVRPPGRGKVVAPSRLPAGHVFFGEGLGLLLRLPSRRLRFAVLAGLHSRWDVLLR